MSIVFSFAVLRLLDAVPHMNARTGRYWIHTVWVAFLLWWSAVFWWLTWSHSQRGYEFDFPAFVVLVTPPAVLYLCATALVSHAPAEITSWRRYFWSARRRFFGLALALLLCLFFTSTFLQHIPLRHPLRIFQLVLASLFVTGLAARSERAQGAIAVLAASLAVLTVVLSLAGMIRIDLVGGS
jgi:hypothetical protein